MNSIKIKIFAGVMVVFYAVSCGLLAYAMDNQPEASTSMKVDASSGESSESEDEYDYKVSDSAEDEDAASGKDHDDNKDENPKFELEFDEAPDIDEPDLEDTPTAEMILRPLLNLMSDLRDFSVPSHLSICPTAAFSVLGREYHWNTHCGLIEQHRLLIESVMSLAWSITALCIVLKA